MRTLRSSTQLCRPATRGLHYGQELSSTNRPDTFAQTQNTHHKDLACNLMADHRFPRPRRPNICLLVSLKSNQRYREGLVTDVSGPQCNVCPRRVKVKPVLVGDGNEKSHRAIDGKSTVKRAPLK